jgi:acyl-CoA thioesterase FadM
VLTVETRIVDHDGKRIHVLHDMRDQANGERLATAELMFIHVDQSTGKVEPMPEEHASRVAAMAAEHAGSESPPEVGRSVGIRRGKPT